MKRGRLLATATTLAGLVVSMCALAAPAQAGTPRAPHQAGTVTAVTGFVEIVNDHANKCVDVTDASTAIGALTQEWDCTGKNEQQWRQFDLGNGFQQMVSRNSALCLDVRGGQAIEGSRVDQELCDTGRTSQGWRLQLANTTGSLWLVNRLGMCLALSPNTSKNGTAIIIGACSDTTAKFWHFKVL